MTKNMSEAQFVKFVSDKFCYESVVHWYETVDLVNSFCKLFAVTGIVTPAPLDRYATTHGEQCRDASINGVSMWNVGFWKVTKTLVRGQPRYYVTEQHNR